MSDILGTLWHSIWTSWTFMFKWAIQKSKKMNVRHSVWFLELNVHKWNWMSISKQNVRHFWMSISELDVYQVVLTFISVNSDTHIDTKNECLSFSESYLRQFIREWAHWNGLALIVSAANFHAAYCWEDRRLEAEVCELFDLFCQEWSRWAAGTKARQCTENMSNATIHTILCAPLP